MFIFFLFPFERTGTVLCSWFKEIGTNTLTGWDGAEPLIFAVWWVFSLNEYFPARENRTLTMFFSLSVLCYLENCIHSGCIYG